MNHETNKALNSIEDTPDKGSDISGDEIGTPREGDGPCLLDMTGDEDGYPPPQQDGGQSQDQLRWTDVTAGEDVAIPNDVLKTRLAKVQLVMGPLPIQAGDGESVATDLYGTPGAPVDTGLPAQKDESALPPVQDPDLNFEEVFPAEDPAAALKALSDKMDFLASEFSGKLKYDAHKDKIIDALHKELQDYKGDIVKKNMKSMVMDLIKIIDDVRKITVYYQAKEAEPTDVPKLINALEGVSQDLEEVLSIQGVEASVREEALFSPPVQRALRLIPTTDPSRDKTVAYSIAPGFEWGGRVLRKEMVAVYTLDPENGKNQ
jgi:molecular chaperone GrpE (heat shock protein)